MRKFILPMVILIASILLIVFEWAKFDLAIQMNTFAIGTLTWIVYILYAVLGIGTILYAILMCRTIKWQAFISVALFLITLTYVFLYPLSIVYTNAEFEKNLAKRIETVKLVESNQISEYQINVDEYIVPYRETSHTGTMLVQRRNGITKVMFYSYKGLMSARVIVYVSDNSGIEINDFNLDFPGYIRNYSQSRQMTSNWFSVNFSLGS